MTGSAFQSRPRETDQRNEKWHEHGGTCQFLQDIDELEADSGMTMADMAMNLKFICHTLGVGCLFFRIYLH